MHFMTWWPLPASRSRMRSWVTSAYGVGAAGKQQACWMENARFVACSAIWSAQKSVFCRYLPIRGSYSTHRCLELKIWLFSWQRQTDSQTKLITLHLVHACGVNITSNIRTMYREIYTSSCELIGKLVADRKRHFLSSNSITSGIPGCFHSNQPTSRFCWYRCAAADPHRYGLGGNTCLNTQEQNVSKMAL